jgi:hypothetical protein
MVASMIADITAIPFLGDKPFLSGFPPGIELHHARNYLLVAVLAVVAALMGLAFKAVLRRRPPDTRLGHRPRRAAGHRPQPDLTLAPGDRVSLPTAVPHRSPERHPGGEHDAQPADRETSHPK